MNDDSAILIRRPTSPRGIALTEWLAYIAQSDVVQLLPTMKGTNPFTKQPMEFKPRPGLAFFETRQGRCSISYKDGTLVVSDVDAQALAVLKTIAEALNATLQIPHWQSPKGPMSDMARDLCGTWQLSNMPEITWSFNADGTGSVAANEIAAPIKWSLNGNRLLIWAGDELEPDRKDIISVDDQALVVLPWDEGGPMAEMELYRVK